MSCAGNFRKARHVVCTVIASDSLRASSAPRMHELGEDEMSRTGEADRELLRVAGALVVIGLIGFVLGLVLRWQWLAIPAVLLFAVGAALNLVRFLPVRAFWK